MKFSLPAAVVFFCATTTLAFPQTNNFNDIVARNDDGLDLSEVDITNVDIDSVGFDANDFDSLVTRATKHCANQGKIKRVKKEYKGKCHPDNSRGFDSAHNCIGKVKGKSYLCVQDKKATCYTVKDAEKKNFENGECFVSK